MSGVMNSKNSKKTGKGPDAKPPASAEGVRSTLEELEIEEGSKGTESSSDNQEPSFEPLTCDKFTKLHLRLLAREYRAASRDRRRPTDEAAFGLGRLVGLVVLERLRTGHGFHVWVLQSPRTLEKKAFPNERARVWLGTGTIWVTAVVMSKTTSQLKLVMDKNKELFLLQTVDMYEFDDNSTYERMRSALKKLPSLGSGPAGCLRATLFAEPECPLEPAAAKLPPQLLDTEGELQLFDTDLDPSQREAVEFMLRQPRLAITDGPPGTGKTTTAVEVILQHVERGQRVLVCAPSNVAVDNLLQKLYDAEMANMVRLGHPARIKESLLDFWLDKWVLYIQEDWEARLGEDWDDQPGEKELKRKAIEEAEVVLCTLATACEQGPLSLTKRGGAFDLLVIDECSQALEAECWLAIPRAKKLLLFGDPKQLAPMLRDKSSGKNGLALSLMERQMRLHGDAVVRRLDTQYRMHELIQEWSSECHYGGLLTAAPTVLRHRLSQLEGVSDTEDTGPILLLVDTAGCNLTESIADGTRSRRNVGEADIVAAHAAALAGDGVRQEDMGVITPYTAQTTLIRDRLQRRQLQDVEVNTVDGFQGREKEVILLSFVRSNETRNIGFLGDRRRINVAVTRARRQLFVVCDTSTLFEDEVLASLIAHLRQKSEVRPARVYVKYLSAAALGQLKSSK